MRLPLVGQTVLFNLGEGQVPAVVMRVRDDKPGEFKLDLAVFTGADGDPLRYTTFISQGDKKGEWQWPDIPLS